MPTRLYNQQKSAAGKPAADHFLLCVAMAAVPQRCLSAPLRGPVVLSALKDLLRGEAKNPRPPSCHFAFCILRSLAPVPGAGGKARRADCPRYRLVQLGSGGQAMLVPTGECRRESTAGRLPALQAGADRKRRTSNACPYGRVQAGKHGGQIARATDWCRQEAADKQCLSLRAGAGGYAER